MRQITDKAREFGAGPLFNQILPLLMSPTLEDQERHLLVKVIDRILYKLDDLVRPYVHKVGSQVVFLNGLVFFNIKGFHEFFLTDLYVFVKFKNCKKVIANAVYTFTIREKFHPLARHLELSMLDLHVFPDLFLCTSTHHTYANMCAYIDR